MTKRIILGLCLTVSGFAFAAEQRASVYLTDLDFVFYTNANTDQLQVRGTVKTGTVSTETGEVELKKGTPATVYVPATCADLARTTLAANITFKVEGRIEKAELSGTEPVIRILSGKGLDCGAFKNL